MTLRTLANDSSFRHLLLQMIFFSFMSTHGLLDGHLLLHKVRGSRCLCSLYLRPRDHPQSPYPHQKKLAQHRRRHRRHQHRHHLRHICDAGGLVVIQTLLSNSQNAQPQAVPPWRGRHHACASGDMAASGSTIPCTRCRSADAADENQGGLIYPLARLRSTLQCPLRRVVGTS